jgi:signal transduction histidine kinase
MVNFFRVSTLRVLFLSLLFSNNLSAQLKSSIVKNILLDSLYLQAKGYYEAGNYTLALPIYLKIDSIAQEKNILNDIVIKSILDRSEISRTTFTYEGVEMAKDLQMEALKKAEIINSDELVNNVYLRLADMYGLIDQPDSVKVYLDKAFKYYKQQDNVLKLNRAYLVYMSYYYSIDQLDSAGLFLKEGISYLTEKKYPQELAIINYYYASYLEKYRNEYPKALEQFNKTKFMFKELEDTTNRYYWYLIEGIAYTYAGLGDYKSAFEYYQESFDVKRRLDKKSDNDLTISLEKKYQAEKKENEIQLLKAQTALAEKESKTQLFILAAALILILIITVFFFILSRNRKKTNKKLKELDQLKSNFFANISHEFRTPLTLIKAPVELQLASSGLTLHQREHLNSVNRNADRLLILVDQLLDLSKLEAKKISVKVSPMKPAIWFNAISQVFQFSAEQKNIDYQVQIDLPDEEIFLDTQLTEKVINNLLTNAIKYTNEGGTIVFEATIDNGLLKIIVQNTGDLITEENQSRIFDRFYQLNLNGSGVGVGIGLALVKELVELHHGKISFTTDNSYNIFKVEVPIK